MLIFTITRFFFAEMSKATKRKHVLKEVLDDDYSAPTESQQIVRVVCSKGNNLHEVKSGTEEVFLASMPTKFRKNVWIKRGDFVLVESIEEGDKVKAEIVRILTKQHIKYYKKDNIWPSEFDEDSKDGTEDQEGIFCNTNRLISEEIDESDSSDSLSNDNEKA